MSETLLESLGIAREHLSEMRETADTPVEPLL